MSLIFERKDPRDEVWSVLNSYMIKTERPALDFPAVIHWEGCPSSRLQIFTQTWDAAKLIYAALKLDSFENHKAHVVFDEVDIMHIVITKSDLIELPSVYTMRVQGTA